MTFNKYKKSIDNGMAGEKRFDILAQKRGCAVIEASKRDNMIRKIDRYVIDENGILKSVDVKIMKRTSRSDVNAQDTWIWVEFNNVNFGYASNKQQILFDINFSFPKGSKIAFVGTTGSGKSTIIDLIMGLLKPSKGRVLIDGIPLDDMNCAQWQKQISHVPQKMHLIDATIAENIVLGSSLEKIDHELLNEVVTQAQ